MAGGANQPGGVNQYIDDLIRTAVNGITWGYSDNTMKAFGEQNTDAKTAAARQNTGFIGDVAHTAGAALPLAAGGELALGARSLLPAIGRAVFSKAGAGAAALGLGALVAHNARTNDDGTPKAPTPAPAKTAVAAVKQPDINAIAKQIADAVRGSAAPEAQPAGFDGMVARLAAGQGGNVSLRQLSALSEVAQRGAQADYYSAGGGKRPPSTADQLMSRMAEYNKGVHEQAIKNGVPQATADADWANSTKDLLKLDPMQGYLRSQLGGGGDQVP